MSLNSPHLQQDDWLSDFHNLVSSKLITGFAFVSAKGLLHPAIGPLSSICQPSVHLPLDVLSIAHSFQSSNDCSNTITLLGKKLQVVHRTDCSFYAIGHRRTLCLAAFHLPLNLGCLLVTFDRTSHLPVVCAELEKAARRLIVEDR